MVGCDGNDVASWWMGLAIAVWEVGERCQLGKEEELVIVNENN